MNDNVVDLNEFLDRVQGDKELLLELFEIFVEDYTEKRKLMGDAVVKKNFEEIKSIAHSLKGASGNISAKSLRETFLRFEEMGRSNKTDGAETILKNMDKQFIDLLKCIEEIKMQYKSE